MALVLLARPAQASYNGPLCPFGVLGLNGEEIQENSR